MGVGEFGGELVGLLEVVDGFADLAPHARQERDTQIAATLDKMARRELRQTVSTRGRSAAASGTQRARQDRRRELRSVGNKQESGPELA